MLSNNLTIEINRIEILNIRELFEKAELILISNNRSSVRSRRVEDGSRPMIFTLDGWALLMLVIGVATMKELK